MNLGNLNQNVLTCAMTLLTRKRALSYFSWLSWLTFSSIWETTYNALIFLLILILSILSLLDTTVQFCCRYAVKSGVHNSSSCLSEIRFECSTGVTNVDTYATIYVKADRWCDSFLDGLAWQIPEWRSSTDRKIVVVQWLLIVRCVRAHMFGILANTLRLLVVDNEYVFLFFSHFV